MKRIVSRTVYKQVPDLSQPPEPTPDKLFVRLFGYPPSPHATFGWDYMQVQGGYVPVNSIPELRDEEEEYLSVGELRAVLEGVPDDTPVGVSDDEGYAEATSAKYDGKTLDIGWESSD